MLIIFLIFRKREKLLYVPFVVGVDALQTISIYMYVIPKKDLALHRFQHQLNSKRNYEIIVVK